MATPRQIELNRQLGQAWWYEEVLQVVHECLEEFNLVNCTTALLRLAKAGGPDRGLGELKPLLARTVRLAREAGHKCPAQNLANALWACERLGAAGTSEASSLVACTLTAVADEKRLRSFTGQNLANASWAAVKLGCADFGPFASAISQRAWDLNGQELSMAAWSLASFGEASSEVNAAFSSLVQAALALQGGIRALSGQQIATLAWAGAKLGRRELVFLKEIADVTSDRVEQFNAQDIANVTWAFGRLSMPAPALFSATSRVVQRILASKRYRESFCPQHLSMLVWAFAKLSLVGDAMVLSVVREARRRIADLAPRDL